MKKFLLIVICLFNSLKINGQAEKKKLSDYSFNVYSQYGEDGIIKKIFEIIEAKSQICIEFGAADGFFFSNTANLWKNQNWQAILIEPDGESFKKLIENTRNYNCKLINTYVDIENNNIDSLITENLKIHDDIDLLSIDIDGNDYYILESVNLLKPSVIICEYNPTIPAHLDIYPDYAFQNLGCSVGALKRIAESKGYFLAAITETNCFFIDNKYKHLFEAYEISLDKIKIDEYIKYLITDYIGRPIIVGETPNYSYGINGSGTNYNIYNNNQLNYAKTEIHEIRVTSPYFRR